MESEAGALDFAYSLYIFLSYQLIATAGLLRCPLCAGMEKFKDRD